MGLFDVTQAALEKALEGSALRQRALANNLANANTAGFKRSDVDFQSALDSALSGGPQVQSAQVESTRFAVATDTSSSARADGNNVDVDTEMADLSENSVTYQALVAVAKARLHMLEIAIGAR